MGNDSSLLKQLFTYLFISLFWVPRWHSGKNWPANAEDTRDAGLIPKSGRSNGEGNGNPHSEYSGLEGSADEGAW